MTQELLPDTRPNPWELPDDAIAVLRWLDGTPPRWELVGIVTDTTVLDEALKLTARQRPDLAGGVCIATELKDHRAARLQRSEQLTVEVALEEI